jgi:hypothetical protein
LKLEAMLEIRRPAPSEFEIGRGDKRVKWGVYCLLSEGQKRGFKYMKVLLTLAVPELSAREDQVEKQCQSRINNE